MKIRPNVTYTPAEVISATDFFQAKLAYETDPSDVYADIKNDVANFVLIDVRSPKDYAKSHAITAINIHHSQMTKARMAEFSPETLFVVYCWGPGCNGADKAAYRLSQLGRPVKMMMGGIEYWQDIEKLPVVQAEAT